MTMMLVIRTLVLTALAFALAVVGGGPVPCLGGMSRPAMQSQVGQHVRWGLHPHEPFHLRCFTIHIIGKLTPDKGRESFCVEEGVVLDEKLQKLVLELRGPFVAVGTFLG